MAEIPVQPKQEPLDLETYVRQVSFAQFSEISAWHFFAKLQIGKHQEVQKQKNTHTHEKTKTNKVEKRLSQLC